jgi:hypothetical protein
MMEKTLAKDGKPFDIDYKMVPTEEEVEVIQYLRPNGKRRRMLAPVGKKYVEKAKDLIISVEELTTGEVAIYVRKINDPIDDEVMELAYNGPGDNSPTNVLRRLIDKKLS